MPSDARVTALVQARMGSTRLPGKVLLDLGRQSVLSRVVNRVRRSLVHEVAVAATESDADGAIVRECERLRVPCFRGSESDVLDRYLRAAWHFGSHSILRITSDCPLVDPEVINQLVRAFAESRVDFASNVAPRTYPRGLDAEVFTVPALEIAWRIAREPHQLEHVTPIFYERPDLFRTASVRGDQDYTRFRWTLDTPEDLRLVRAIYEHFGNRDNFSWREVITLMESDPRLELINSHIVQKSMPAAAPPLV
jgi:spore coat polysaccharide biosynthesis protein SpsF